MEHARRHGVSFQASSTEVGGLSLGRSPLIVSRPGDDLGSSRSPKSRWYRAGASSCNEQGCRSCPPVSIRTSCRGLEHIASSSSRSAWSAFMAVTDDGRFVLVGNQVGNSL